MISPHTLLQWMLLLIHAGIQPWKGAHGGDSRAGGGDTLSKKNSNLKHFMKIAEYM